VGWLVEAQATGLAAWWLLWGGFGRRYWGGVGLAAPVYLTALAVIWVAGWWDWVPGRSGPVVNGGLMLAGAAVLTACSRRRRASTLVPGLLLALVTIVLRGLAPLTAMTAAPLSGDVPEALAVGLLAGLWVRDPWRAAAAAALATIAAGVWATAARGTMPGQLGPAAWNYVVTAATTAWLAAAAWDWATGGRRPPGRAGRGHGPVAAGQPAKEEPRAESGLGGTPQCGQVRPLQPPYGHPSGVGRRRARRDPGPPL
jgi:hypothetical protein